MDHIGAVDGAKRELINEYSRSLKILLETKHLYQKVTIDFDSIAGKFRKLVQPQDAAHLRYFDSHLTAFAKERFAPSLVVLNAMQRGVPDHLLATLVLKNIKIYCNRCKSSEVFQPIWFVDAANEILKRNLAGELMEFPLKDNFQMIFIAFQCQRCKNDPEGFLIRRASHSLYLEGRSPIEHIDLPAYIPKKESRLFSDAIIAFNAGKILAGLFYLRAFIEQFARRQTKTVGKITGDEIMESYGKLLPEDLRGRIPSLRECYEKLSIPIHLAEDDADVFEAVRLDIDRHFDMRRVFSIAEIA
jgi:hypothetical protein